MLEYLRHWEGLYPFYPQVELLGLRAECARLQSYQKLLSYLVGTVWTGELEKLIDDDDLPNRLFLGILEDPDICSSWLLVKLLKREENPLNQERILQRMRSWRDFDWGALEQIVLGTASKNLPIYLPCRELYLERCLKQLKRKYRQRQKRAHHRLLQQYFRAWRTGKNW
jgi:hypothetical protein